MASQQLESAECSYIQVDVSSREKGKNTPPSVSKHTRLLDTLKPARTEHHHHALSFPSLEENDDFQETSKLRHSRLDIFQRLQRPMMYDSVALLCLTFSQAANYENRPFFFPFLQLSSYYERLKVRFRQTLLDSQEIQN